MSLNSSMAPEIIARIYESCDDFKDVLSFALTSKWLHSTWVSQTSSISLHVGRTNILCFDQALILVRATEIVRSAWLRGDLPPEIVLDTLSPAARKPSIEELKSILDVRFYVRYLEHRFHFEADSRSRWARDFKHLLNKTPKLLDEWRHDFHQAAYRFFIAGAALARTFQKPFFDCLSKTHSHFRDNNVFFEETASKLSGNEYMQVFSMPDSELEFLSSYPAYQFTHSVEWDECFKQLTDWLLSQARSSVPQESGSGDAKALNKQALRETLQMLAMFGQMYEVKGSMGEGWERYWSLHRFGRQPHPCPCRKQRDDALSSIDAEYNIHEYYMIDSNDEFEGNESYIEWFQDMTQHEDKKVVKDAQGNPNWKVETRRFVLVPFGSFEPWKYKLKSGPSITSYSSCVRTLQFPNEDAGDGPMVTNYMEIMDIVHCMSGRPNHVITPDGVYPTPHPPLHFFNYIFRKQFQYQFDEKAFDFAAGDSVYERFIRDGLIFTKLGNWDGLLTSSHIPQSYVYREIPYLDCE